jgi:hypothetical protein
MKKRYEDSLSPLKIPVLFSRPIKTFHIVKSKAGYSITEMDSVFKGKTASKHFNK